MAGVGPYGIEQVDVPGILNNVQNVQFNRVRMMMAQKQLEMQDLMMNRQLGAMKALQAYAGSLGSNNPQSGSDSSASRAPSATGSPPTAPVTSMPHANDVIQSPTGYDTSGAPTTAEMANRDNLFKSLLFVNPEMAGQIADAFKGMDAEHASAVVSRNMRVSQLAASALQLPQNERPQFMAQHAAELQSLGVQPQQLQGFQPTDDNLRQLVAEGMDVQRIAEFAKPQMTEVRQGSTQRLVNPDQTSQTMFESPTVVGPEGQVFARPPQMSTMPRAVTATDAHGNKIQFNSSTGQWEPIGGQTASPSGTFQQ